MTSKHRIDNQNSSITNSIQNDNGDVFVDMPQHSVNTTIDNSLATVIDSQGLTIYGNGSTSRKIYFKSADSTTAVSVNAPNSGITSYNITLPGHAGTTGQLLTLLNNTGTTDWVSLPGTGDVLHTGNSFGSAISIGTLDNFDLLLVTNAVARIHVTAAGDIGIVGDGTASKSLAFNQADNTASVRVKAPTNGVTTYTVTLPGSQAAAGASLINDGSGALSWGFPVSNGVTYAETTVTSSTMLSAAQVVNADATAGAITLTLPAVAANIGRIYYISKTDAGSNAVTIIPATGERLDRIVDNALTLASEDDYVTLLCRAKGWFII